MKEYKTKYIKLIICGTNISEEYVKKTVVEKSLASLC